ncbi:NADH-quinone oxidoreductase subunit J [bacterium]|nr:NADH-quinone oxidoreductase subunit J [bacterium]
MGHAVAFYVFGILAVALALATILHKNIFKSATFLAGMLFCLAALFVTLDAEFLAVVQVLVYIGAITMLIVFAIMLTTRINDETRGKFNSQLWISSLTTLGFLGLIISVILKGGWNETTAMSGALPPDMLGAIGTALLSDFILAFDVVSILLLVALIGALHIAKQDDRKPYVQESFVSEEDIAPKHHVKENEEMHV